MESTDDREEKSVGCSSPCYARQESGSREEADVVGEQNKAGCAHRRPKFELSTTESAEKKVRERGLVKGIGE